MYTAKYPLQSGKLFYFSITTIMKFRFKEETPAEQRRLEAEKIRAKYPERIPVVVERVPKSQIPEIDKRKFLVPNDITMAQFMWIIRKRILLAPEKAIFLFVDKTIPQSSQICNRIYRMHSTGDISGFPFIATLVNCTLWLLYGYSSSNSAILLVNSIGAFLQTLYILFYVRYTQDRKDVVQKQSTDSLSFPLCFANFVVATEWFLYGLLINDKFVQVPNFLGAILGLIQMTDLCQLFDNAKKFALNVKNETKLVEENDEKTDEVVKKPHEDPMIANKRTIFVGNVPISCNQKDLKKLFSSYGKIESVRLRNIVPSEPKISKRVSFIRKQFHPSQKSLTAFIRFSHDIEAQQATELNGQLFKTHHLRVDLASDKKDDDSTKKHDNKRSIFIGSLPFDVNDDDVWSTFENCGDIESVRIIRDKQTQIGKGFGYVLFKDQAAVGLALKMKDCKIGEREIRIKAAVKKPKVVTTNHYLPNKNNRFKRINQNDDDEAFERNNTSQDKLANNTRIKLSKKKKFAISNVKQGRVEKKSKKSKDMNDKKRKKPKKKNLSIKTSLEKGVIHMRKKS
ncbi:unnamed protein product [Didymodactylos carnosus]|uniref:RRM domain-containing protein n=1 Tax=Didymodactylos carnosus TaxID=1234261 RepID=A0A814D6M6_9BILA|nr:unnamed protein product [Didymodactylos carnosus]CAF0954117.1 unnamed protein product [Didymodactylos carnosus]CAF3727680.1 unnamed protein product [Didymodactylos carnosus]CAF3728443.1 unnamed protein product [Didymodactylos carnosus]